MNKERLSQAVDVYIQRITKDPVQYQTDLAERVEIVAKYRSYTREVLSGLDEAGLYAYISPLWAMRIWGNKQYAIDKMIEQNGITKLKKQLEYLLWSSDPLEERWDTFKSDVKGFGNGIISELLCRTHPNDHLLWNRRALVALDYLGVKDLPRYDYQMTGERYSLLCERTKQIAAFMESKGVDKPTLLEVDYFFWEDLQVEPNLSKIGKNSGTDQIKPEVMTKTEQKFIHNDVRDKLSDIGRWLGFNADIEQNIADGSRVDTIWEATIGNMGRVIYVFEVQTKGSIDSLILNLLKSLNNPAVQGVVAVSDKDQIEKIRKHTIGVPDLKEKLRYWDYEEILKVHESLQFVNESINELKLVPEGFVS